MRYNFDYNFYFKGSNKKPAIIFLHGFMGCGSDWSTFINKLSDDFFCIAPDLAGHGKNLFLKSKNLYSIPETSAQLIKIIKFLNIKKSVLCGYSMGGRISFFSGIYFPEYFSKIIIESSTPGIISDSERKSRVENDEQLAIQIENEPFQNFLKRWYTLPLFKTINKKLRTSIIKEKSHNNPSELAKSLRMSGTGVQTPLWYKIDSLKIPFHLLTGELDRKFNTIASEIVSLNPDIKHHSFKNCGHNIHLENEAHFLKTLLKIIS